MSIMKDTHIAKLEAHLEKVIEGVFARFFGRKIRAQDVALQLARSMEDGLRVPGDDDIRRIAPDSYQIRLSTETQAHLSHQAGLAALLSDHIVGLATQAGYRLDASPIIELLPDATLNNGEIRVTASHMVDAQNSTAVLVPVSMPATRDDLKAPQLVVGNRTILLEEPLITIGRHPENLIVLDDPRVSRYHVQIRLRFGSYTLFDVQSRSGTFVNDVVTQEHTLQSGDVIRVGQTRLLYLEDDEDEQTNRGAPPHPKDPA
jgi:hypothetical protein